MTIGIVGSRSFTDEALMRKIISDILREQNHQGLSDRFVVVSGGAVGADAMAARLAPEYRLGLIEHLPDEGVPSPGRFFARNSLIVRDSDVLLAFFGPGEPPSVNKSGTMDTVRKAIAKRIPVHLYFQEP